MVMVGCMVVLGLGGWGGVGRGVFGCVVGGCVGWVVGCGMGLIGIGCDCMGCVICDVGCVWNGWIMGCGVFCIGWMCGCDGKGWVFVVFVVLLFDDGVLVGVGCVVLVGLDCLVVWFVGLMDLFKVVVFLLVYFFGVFVIYCCLLRLVFVFICLR